MARLFILIFILGMLVMPSHLSFAQGKYQIKQMTPEVSAALEGRKSRFESVKELKAKGSIGENNRGYVEALDNSADTKALAEAENKDRKIIYQTIASQNGLDDALDTIEKVFAQVQRDKADPGHKYQAQDESWVVK